MCCCVTNCFAWPSTFISVICYTFGTLPPHLWNCSKFFSMYLQSSTVLIANITDLLCILLPCSRSLPVPFLFVPFFYYIPTVRCISTKNDFLYCSSLSANCMDRHLCSVSDGPFCRYLGFLGGLEDEKSVLPSGCSAKQISGKPAFLIFTLFPSIPVRC
jgi:hypothetical protein